MLHVISVLFLFVVNTNTWKLPGSCNASQYFDPISLTCFSCPNTSMVSTNDRFSCLCKPNSIPSGVAQCKPCAPTEVISADGTSCVPRRCQNVSGRISCRKCPNEYITVTQNIDGSPLKEMNCVKCARGYKPAGNACVRCESCVCDKSELVIRGSCVSRKYVADRPKYTDINTIHPTELLDIVKMEYLCSEGDVKSCRGLANKCVKHFYSSDLPGPCRLWLAPSLQKNKDQPELTIQSTSIDKNTNEITLARGKDTINIVAVPHVTNGGVKFLAETKDRLSPCMLPVGVTIGYDSNLKCQYNITEAAFLDIETISPYLLEDDDYKALKVSLRKPNGEYVERGLWSSSKFRRYFLTATYLSTTANITNTVYLNMLLLRLRIEKIKFNSLNVKIDIEAQYAMKSMFSDVITTSLVVEHEFPSTGVLREIEIWGGVLAAFLILYAIVEWRGAVRRGAHLATLVPMLAGVAADVLYFSSLFAVVRATAVEAAIGLALPLSQLEENTIKVLLYCSTPLKIVKLLWINYKHCRCDVTLIDWSLYNPCLKDATDNLEESSSWKTSILSREWLSLQTIRRAPPGYTVTLTLIFMHFLVPWQASLPNSDGYKWAIASTAWWISYIIVLLCRWAFDKIAGAPVSVLPTLCSGIGLSLLVFEEEYYAHYVHGRNAADFSESRSLSGALTTCRIVCSPQLREIHKRLSLTSEFDQTEEGSPRLPLLSKFLAAFIERALDGLSWVASERTTLEKLLDVELVDREAGSTSSLLYDSNNTTPSCFNVTWWGAEWCLATFDAVLFGFLVMTVQNVLIAALVTLAVWLVMKNIKMILFKRNFKQKINVQTTLY